MAFDGITIACMAHELQEKLTGGRISKIAQPEADELLLTVKSREGNFRLLLSASAGLPLVYLTGANKPGPMTAPNFCMLLRKHISGGRILSVTQPSLERILRFEIEHLDELGDLCRKYLVVEIMGKHSNIIFCSDTDQIIDSIKHVSAQMSSVREVLPGRAYFIPDTQEKADPLGITEENFTALIRKKAAKLSKALYTSLTGLSPVAAEEICAQASLDSDRAANSYEQAELIHLYRTFTRFLAPVRSGAYEPVIYYDGKTPVEFSCLPLTVYEHCRKETFSSVSGLLERYYAEKNTLTRIRQKSTDLRRIVQTALERNIKKYDLQAKQLKDTEKREKYRIYGELINTYGYGVEPGSKSFEALNYYTGEMVTIPLDPQIPVQENAKKYFDKYGKLKRTCEAVTKLLEETGSEVEHLRSVQTALDIALQEEDLVQIKEELMQSGYIRKRNPGSKRPKITSKPFHYISSDGYHMYVGKNNLQNEELTFQTARGNDWWFHAKGAPGSHVIVQTNGGELPDTTFEEAARLAAYYSSNRGADKVEIDYVEKKHVKKPNGSRPGFVVYYTNYSMMIDSDISGIRQA
ncbi:MAG: fibronectin/fibrinogen-binding protein [Lachnospiraceae bacterium]|jgi:predicted ribosome quality control (RQC) complex YloA/Tae2 family protein|nr:fibronectin/fibrinogen-binding protein [Lachnospiraceae bacterium]MCI9601813.1 fibronectin/fibrinogen-binding protein [Lachnospiraceae bacterium]